LKTLAKFYELRAGTFLYILGLARKGRDYAVKVKPLETGYIGQLSRPKLFGQMLFDMVILLLILPQDPSFRSV